MARTVLRCLQAISAMIIIAAIVIGGGTGPGQAAAQPGGVHIVPVTGVIDPVLARFIARSLDSAEQNGAALVILEINTLGGRVDAALDIRDAVRAARVPVVSFVRERAWSAGALIAMAAPRLIMAPGSSMGAAEPRPADEKTISALRAEFEATADAWGRDPRLAAAMVDKSIAIEGVVEQGELLTLTYHQALDLGMADAVQSSRHDIMAEAELASAPVTERSLRHTERLARLSVHPTVSTILLTLGFLGLVTEVTSPGFGVPGMMGLSCLGAFFGGHLIAGFAGWEVVALFLLGLLLLAVEVFVPGFGVFGIGGIVSIVVSIFLASASTEQALQSLIISVVATVVLAVVLSRYLGKRGFWTRLALGDSLSTAEGYVPALSRERLLGSRGVAITPLRPSGTGQFEGERVDVVSDGGFIPINAEIVVSRIEGMRVVVRRLDEGDAPM